MQFSITFLLFLAVLLPLFFALPRRARPYLLLAASVAFYAFAGWRALCVMTALATLTYAIGRWLGYLLSRGTATLEAHRTDGSWDKPTRKAYRLRLQRRVRLLLALGIVLDIGMLLFFKLGLPSRLGAADWLLPLGMSFVTLSAVGYLCDVARAQIVCERNFLRFALFVFFFPQMWQGPIVRYGELAPQLCAPQPFEGTRVRAGALRALWGGVKKLVFADTAAVATAALLAHRDELGGAGMLVLVPLYTLQIYGDFTGGMDIALGVSQMLGIELYENFDKPFSSPSLKEYWRRWHRSLGRFFTDYVYYPLSVSRLSQWLARRVGTRVPLYLAVLTTWLLTGLWHGAAWNFVLWGLLNGLFLLLSQELRPLRARPGTRLPRVARSRGWQNVLCLGTLFTAALLRTLDLSTSVGTTLSLWIKMLTPGAWRTLLDIALWQTLGLNGAEWLLLGLGALLMWMVGHASPRVDADAPPLRTRLARRPVLCGALCALAIVAIFVLGRYGVDYDAAQFIYGQF